MKQQVKIGGIYNDRTLHDNCIVLVARKDGIIFGVDVEGVQETRRNLETEYICCEIGENDDVFEKTRDEGNKGNIIRIWRWH